MKLLHLSDLHVGKRLNEFSLLEDQGFIWQEILRIIGQERPDVVLLAGDIYDKAFPSTEAVQFFDRCLSQLYEMGLVTLVISGNHDAPERISFGAGLMRRSGIFIAPVFDGNLYSVTLEDAYGDVVFHLLPFVRPAHVRRAYPEDEIGDYQTAIAAVLAHNPVDTSRRNVLMTHQSLATAQVFGTEENAIGGTEQISAALFDDFDYVALGHIHRAQPVGRETIRYAGSPLKYSTAEAGYQKSVTIVELHKKDNVQVRLIPLRPKHDLRLLAGQFSDFLNRQNPDYGSEDYLQITLTDETDIPDAARRLRAVYPRLIRLEYDNARTRRTCRIDAPTPGEERSPLAYFAELFLAQNNRPLSPEQTRFLQGLFEKIGEEQAF